MGDDGYYEKDGDQLAFTISNGQADQVRIDMSNICAQNLQDIGVNCKVEVVAETDWANQDAYLIGWGSPFDPDDHTYKVFGTDKGANYSSYSNAKVDELLQQARELETQEERLPLYKEFQVELSKDLPYTLSHTLTPCMSQRTILPADKRYRTRSSRRRHLLEYI